MRTISELLEAGVGWVLLDGRCIRVVLDSFSENLRARSYSCLRSTPADQENIASICYQIWRPNEIVLTEFMVQAMHGADVAQKRSLTLSLEEDRHKLLPPSVWLEALFVFCLLCVELA